LYTSDPPTENPDGNIRTNVRDMTQLQAGTLRARTREALRRARQSGALHTIPTSQVLLEEAGIPFIIRRLVQSDNQAAALRNKEQGTAAFPNKRSPFLPYDTALFVTDISATHVCLLNKYNVMPEHLLIVTRAFEEQESLLTLADFEALWRCMAEFDGLGFYNGGKAAGASQRHKHLQFVPVPLQPQGPPVPIAPALEQIHFDGMLGYSPLLPFVHAGARVDPHWLIAPAEGARATLDLYDRLLAAVGLPPDRHSGHQPGPYNLLLTRRWLWLVPRSQEHVDGISLNALGFAGSLFVRDEQQYMLVQQLGPLAVLSRGGLQRT
jgi:sulfate adenylyltransferase (ADP) / ATP adenylyltransferase